MVPQRRPSGDHAGGGPMSAPRICAFCDLDSHVRCTGCACTTRHPTVEHWSVLIGDLHEEELLTDTQAFRWLREASGLPIHETVFVRLADLERRAAEDWLPHDEWRERWG
jgi:hypothetical protein